MYLSVTDFGRQLVETLSATPYLVKGVYCLYNSYNGKLYVGSSSSCIRKRWLEHLTALNRGRHCNKHLQAAWVKYKQYFQAIILEVTSSEACVSREQIWIDFYCSSSRKWGYNLNPIAGSSLGRKFPTISVMKKGVKRPLSVGQAVGKANRARKGTYTLDQKQAQRLKSLGRRRSEETKAKISESKRKWWQVVANRERMSNKTSNQWSVRNSRIRQAVSRKR